MVEAKSFVGFCEFWDSGDLGFIYGILPLPLDLGGIMICFGGP